MPDENYVMDIVYSGGTFSFPITPKYFPSLTFNWKRDGKEVAVIDTIPVHGWFSEADQDTIIARWNTLLAISQNGNFVTVRMKKQSGTVFANLQYCTIENLRSNDSDGGHVNHIEFDFNVREERGVTFPQLVNVEHEDEEIKEVVDRDGESVTVNKFRRRVLATGVRGDTAAARAFVMSLKPSLSHMVRESIRTVNYDGDVEGIWEFDDTQRVSGRDTRRWHERVTYMPGIRSHKFYKTSGVPVLIEGGFGESKLRVEGTIERYDENFPDPEAICSFFNGAVGAATDVIFDAPPEIGGRYVTEWDAEDPTIPFAWAMDYSYTLAFGEANPKPAVAPRPRNAIFQA